GLIGRSWAMLFASAGFKVKLYDIEQRQVTYALDSIRKEMKLLEQSGSLKGSLGAEEQLSLISSCSDIREAVEGALHVQECVPENLELKKQLFAQLDGIVGDQVVLSSSSSCLLPTRLFSGLVHVKQCLVAHPVNVATDCANALTGRTLRGVLDHELQVGTWELNLFAINVLMSGKGNQSGDSGVIRWTFEYRVEVNPPYYVPLVELVPHPETAPATVDRTYALMRKIGQSPVRLMKEVDGFALNRLQYAIISEAWRLVEVCALPSLLNWSVACSAHTCPAETRQSEQGSVQEGVVSPGDLDLVMSDGLGMRYAFIGPLETMHLNAEGMLSYCDRYSEGMKHVLKTFGPVPEFSGAAAEKVHQAMCVKVPDDPEHLAARREWRDRCLMRLARLKSQLQPQ
ncbi:hypothetical protein DBR06_SOUSAS2610127, partial [Sousa chinensis]